MTVHIFGIRHHGPGSARSLLHALESLQPDCILIEGPPDADPVISLAAHQTMQPPVALLVYVPDQPQRAAYYPFAVFSPEWQALRFALSRGIPASFMDLPQQHVMALTPKDFPQDQPAGDEAAPSPNGAGDEMPVLDLDGDDSMPEQRFFSDPLGWLAEAAGYEDSERWWEHMVEQRLDSADLFEAIIEAMTVLRAHAEAIIPYSAAYRHYEALREAHMRKTLRVAMKKHERIAVVCGAWHTPALANLPPAKEDDKLLKTLPKVKTEATWVPWTYGRLSRLSGYGAGIESPGWYHHLWTTPPDQIAIGWMTHVARLLRDERLDASPAQTIDAVRLSETLAALRNRPVPGLPEMNEAAQTVFCFGSAVPMQLIQRRLIVSETLGGVPDETPMVPLQRDFLATLKTLRLKLEPVARNYDLDLREKTDLARSHLLHRLKLLGVPWGRQHTGKQGAKGTFHEYWIIAWQPEYAVNIIEASIWGNTVSEAANARARDLADNAPDLHGLTTLLDTVMKAALPDAVSHVMKRIEVEAALASDVTRLMDALPPLARVSRYSDVRKTDTELVGQVIDGMVIRLCIGLPGACASLDDDAAAAMFKRVMSVESALALLQKQAHLDNWRSTLAKMLDQVGLHGLLAGRFTRILLDANYFNISEGARRMRLALSQAAEPAQAADWIEGFLSGSGLILLHDDALWAALDAWVAGLHSDAFRALLPLLRRTFSTFQAAERRQMGERARYGRLAQQSAKREFDMQRADRVLPLVSRLLGLGQMTAESEDEP